MTMGYRIRNPNLPVADFSAAVEPQVAAVDAIPTGEVETAVQSPSAVRPRSTFIRFRRGDRRFNPEVSAAVVPQDDVAVAPTGEVQAAVQPAVFRPSRLILRRPFRILPFTETEAEA